MLRYKGLTNVKPLFCLKSMRLIQRFMRFFFHHFYHSLAWTYDFVAAFVSIGRWNGWIRTVLPFVQGTKILEIGHGTGHLQRLLRDQNYCSVGLDESPQMIRLAKRRLEKANPQIIKLVRGLAQALPFPEAEFDSVISTFPSDYIFDLNTLSGIHRVLRGDGRFILVPAAWIASRKLLDRAAAWLFRITGETPRNIREVIGKRAVQPLKQAGFNVEVCELEIHASTVMVILATK
jgi:ubiquinone/menaquinone biosynthesis C-methylase UbiE